jgi:polyisoprenoid-binding protein YceI
MHYALESAPRPEDATVRYIVEAERSTFIVKAFATGLLSSLGHNPTIAFSDFEGEIHLDPNTLQESTLRIVFHAASSTITDDINQKDQDEINRRTHDEVLEADSYPDIVYESSQVSASKTAEGQYWIALNGELTLHGVTRNQPVSTHVSINGNNLRAMGDFSVRQSDYKITPVTALGGAIRLKDDLKITFDIYAGKQG